VAKKSFIKRCLQWFLIIFLVLGLSSAVAGFYLFRHLSSDLPDIKKLRDVQYQIPLTIYSKEKLLIAQFGEKKRIPISISQVPVLLMKAFLAAEDDSFFAHQGVDAKGLLRAGIELALTGKKKQGGSTITMQVTRNFLLSNEKTYTRKLKEIILALKIEREYSKDKILELYLNQIFMGHRAYGIAAAAQVYFDKSLDELTLAEQAMLAGLPKAPSLYNPITNEPRAMERRNYVLRRMLDLKFINQDAYKEAQAEPSTAKLQAVTPQISASYFAEMVRQKMVDQYGDQAYTAGFQVYTTLDGQLQSISNQALANTLHAYDERHGYRVKNTTKFKKDNFQDMPVIGDTQPALVIELGNGSAKVKLQDNRIVKIFDDTIQWSGKTLSTLIKPGSLIRIRQLPNQNWTLTQIPQAEGAFVSLNANNGAISSLTGGFDFSRNKYNRVTQSKRQPGSGFKPIIYTTALEEGYTPASMINDAPVVIDIPGQENEWRPENYSKKFYGLTSLRDAITHSRNIISIRLLQQIGIEKAVATALRFGFTEHQIPKTLSLALGSGDATPLQMARVYATFANGGFLINPYYIERIESFQGETIYEAKPKLACPNCTDEEASKKIYAPRILDPKINFLMNSLLRDVVQRGTATPAKILGRQDLAGKTGTTNEQRDAWFNGYASNFVATAWVGFDDFSPLGNLETGGVTALPMWIEFMKTALIGVTESTLEIPPGIVKAYINPNTGLLTSSSNKNGKWEFFQEEKAPTIVSPSENNELDKKNPNSMSIDQIF